MHQASRHVVGSEHRGGPAGVDRPGGPRRQHRRWTAPRDAGPGERILRLQRRGGRDPVAAGQRREEGRLRRRRRAPRRRGGAASSTTTRACSRSPCTRPARCCSPAPASRRTPAGRTRSARRSTWRCRPAPSDAGWLRAFHAVVPPLLREFAPDILVTQHGCDSHRDDPLAHLALSVDGQRASYLALHDLAHEVGRRTLGRLRRRRLRDRRRGPAGLDPPAGRRLGDPARHRDRDARRLARGRSGSGSAYALRRG